MPEISRFYGIVIRMHRGDHPRPHFHAHYGQQAISVAIADGRITGDFPPRKASLVLRWLKLHREELWVNWHLAQAKQPPRYIEPLE